MVRGPRSKKKSLSNHTSRRKRRRSIHYNGSNIHTTTASPSTTTLPYHTQQWCVLEYKSIKEWPKNSNTFWKGYSVEWFSNERKKKLWKVSFFLVFTFFFSSPLLLNLMIEEFLICINDVRFYKIFEFRLFSDFFFKTIFFTFVFFLWFLWLRYTHNIHVVSIIFTVWILMWMEEML